MAAFAQPASNSPVPQIAPYAPKAAPNSDGAPSMRRSAGARPRVDVEDGMPVAAAVPANLTGYDYVLGAGDKLRISVFGEENLTGEFNVAGNGRLSFPLIGEVEASGKTVRMVRAQIEAALKAGYIKDPRVSAEVLTFRPYYILGEVAKPGEYPYSDGITVMNAVATAGGFTYRANQKYVFLKRSTSATEQKVRLSGDLKLSPGDTVRVFERYF